VDENTLDLRDIVKVIKKRWRFICKVFFAFTIIAAIISLLIPPTYEAETTLRIKQSKGLANSLLGDLGGGNPLGTKQLMSTYAEILKSRTVVQEVIDETQSNQEEPPTYEDMLKLITTQPVKDTEILNVKVQAKSPEEAEILTNTLVDTFLARLTTLVRSEQSQVREFIGQRLGASKIELDKAELDLQKYKEQQKIIDPEEETKAIIDKLSVVDKMAADNQVALEAAKAKLSSSEEQLGRQKDGFVADNPLVQQYKLKQADLEVELVSLSQNYTDKHPKVIAVKAAINEIKANLNSEIAKVVAAEAPSMNPIHQGLLQSKLQSEAEITIAVARKQAMDKILGETEQVVRQLPQKEQGYVKVMRDTTVAREIYVMLAKRHEEARISEVMEPTDVQIIDKAIAPEKPIKPKKTLNVVIAAILGLFVGTGLAFASEYMNKTVRTAEDVRQYLDLPVLGNIPAFESHVGTKKPGIITRMQQLISFKQ